MAPRNARRRAGLRDRLRKQRVALQRVRLVQFAGVHVRLARVTGGIDDEFRLFRLEKFQQHVKTRVIHLLARQRNEISLLAPLQFLANASPM